MLEQENSVMEQCEQCGTEYAGTVVQYMIWNGVKSVEQSGAVKS